MPQPYNNRGLAYAKQGFYDRAILDYSQAITLKPDYAKAYINRGLAYVDKGLYDRAIDDYNKAIHIDPNSEEAKIARQIIKKQLEIQARRSARRSHSKGSSLRQLFRLLR